MHQDATRREFLKIAGLTAASIAAKASLGRPATAFEIQKGTLSLWVTNDDLRVAPVAPVSLSPEGPNVAETVVSVFSEQKFQSILGFGAAFTDGCCSLFHALSPEARKELFHSLFSPEEMNLSVCRTAIGACDNAATVYSFDDGEPDPDLKRFSIEHDRAYILPVLREARAANPNLFLFGSPWSPPGWMKDNGSMLGGCMRHTYMPSYAKYFVKFLQAYEAEGVPVQAITVQNEVDADQQGLMPACFWPQDYEADFVSTHLGPEFERSGVKSKIWIIDHNYNLWGRAIAELETPGVRKYTNAVAWHGYSGEPEFMSRVHNRFPDIEMYWTEGSPDHDDPEYLKCWAVWGQKITTILSNHCRCVTAWTFATDERGKPNVGPYALGGLVTIDSKTKAIYRSGQYWAMRHFSPFVYRHAFRVQSAGGAKDLYHCAFENPDGSLVVVLTNPGGARTCQLQIRKQVANLELSPNSITTAVVAGGM